ncbi:MMPL family transporter [Treponema zioleckii]|uniref:MMPL family transporter n=1 Tax=Treponema zioleckii TaxID=331680 RepID=UPI00168A708A|nr:MMPL family transporter [Treponema zioleckii]
MNMKHFFLRNKILIPAWICFHVLLLLLFGFSVVGGSGVHIDANLFNMLPSSTLSGALGDADQKLSDSTARNVFVLSGSEDFQSAKRAAVAVYNSLCKSENFASLSLYADSGSISDLEQFTAPYRWAMLDADTANSLKTEEGAREFAEKSLVAAYSSFTLTSLSNLSADPFLLDESNVRRGLLAIQDAGTKMNSKDGVLASNYNGQWYVLIRGELTEKGAAIASESNGIADIYRACMPLENDGSGVRFVFQGSAFHSFKSSNSAVQEISIITTITLSVVIILLFLVFRSPIPILASVASIGVSMVAAFSATHFLFGNIHILTLVLGTSLIGSCIDYSLHYFVNWKANFECATGSEIRSHIGKGLFLSLISTEICYLLLVLAPFGLLKQMGIFSAVGIASSFLSVVAIFPLISLPAMSKRKIPLLKNYNSPNRVVRYKLEIIATGSIVVVLAFIIGFNFQKLKIKNDMNKLYTMQGRLKEDTALATEITGYSPKGWFIVWGKTEEELLQHEEEICAKLKSLQGRGYLATSRFIPSLKLQDSSVMAVKNLLPLAKEQLEILGYDEQAYEQFLSDLPSALKNRMIPQTAFLNLPKSIRSVTDMLWLGKIADNWYSIVLPVTVTDEEAYKKIASESGFSYYENKMEDLGQGLDKLTLQIICIFAIAYVLIMIVLKRFYSWKQIVKIASIPAISVMLILAVFSVIGQRIEFFGLTGIILVFGLGLDYVIYMIENLRKKSVSSTSVLKKIEPFAILLSFITTALSFGALAFSSFVPVHTIGLAIFLGLAAAFLCTLF